MCCPQTPAAATAPPPVQPEVLPGTPAPGAPFPFSPEQLVEMAKEVRLLGLALHGGAAHWLWVVGQEISPDGRAGAADAGRMCMCTSVHIRDACTHLTPARCPCRQVHAGDTGIHDDSVLAPDFRFE